MSEPTPIGKRPHRVTSYSVKKYLDEIHSARTAARSMRVERTLAPQRLILSSTSNRGSTTLEEADDRIAAFIDTRRTISEEVMRPALARQRFRSYRAKAQAQMNVFAVPDRGLLADNTMGVGIMLFFGDAVFKSGGGPTKTSCPASPIRNWIISVPVSARSSVRAWSLICGLVKLACSSRTLSVRALEVLV
jgi:hypothetical protein